MSDPAQIHQAIINIMRAVGPIAKAQRNQQQNYNFRGIDDVYNACHPHFAEHGIYSTSEVVSAEYTADTNGKTPKYRTILHMRFTFYASDGSHVSTEVVGEGMDYGGDKATNKAMSAADKYAILQLLKIPTAMVDSDAEPAQPPPAKEAATAQSRGDRVTPENLTALYRTWADKTAIPADATQADKSAAFFADCSEFAGTALTSDANLWTQAHLQAAINGIVSRAAQEATK